MPAHASQPVASSPNVNIVYYFLLKVSKVATSSWPIVRQREARWACSALFAISRSWPVVFTLFAIEV